ncbi:peptidoglycan-associated lipoprotein Pal [Pelagovum pacificum]|uniref:Peptidoglycan-associated lipoprotein n=1 Tax=Pelagovum pacificum TaxID=2588711 RepID=A0A5C5GAE7_9RHOB|nr:peptidoglycan-associated lipoprotein Pal [Pelagovum pacificum]QQA41661.1 peptidoglycan-associated lipoprotein Pal [Pelagovum pacificum]TNY30940.1 peptidoglycan-associated lipoprotein Pal [Pelagovum pacificum]
MKHVTIAALLIAAIAISGCSRRDRMNDTALNPPPTASMPSDSASDPNSPQYFSQTIGDRVLFEVDQHTLTAQGRTILDGQADWLMRNGDYTAVIEGHADEQGTREYNLALGSRRANSVREYLVSKGIASGRLQTVTYGKERPLAVCSQESCYAQNRRAVTVIAAGATS